MTHVSFSPHVDLSLCMHTWIVCNISDQAVYPTSTIGTYYTQQARARTTVKNTVLSTELAVLSRFRSLGSDSFWDLAHVTSAQHLRDQSCHLYTPWHCTVLTTDSALQNTVHAYCTLKQRSILQSDQSVVALPLLEREQCQRTQIGNSVQKAYKLDCTAHGLEQYS